MCFKEIEEAMRTYIIRIPILVGGVDRGQSGKSF